MKRVSILLLAMLLCVSLIGAPVALAATNDVKVPVSGKIVGHPGMSFKGKVVNPRVSYDAAKHVLKTSGTLRGTLVKANGTTERVNQAFTTRSTFSKIGSARQAASCPILTLDIGAIHLDLLGLVVNLSPIHLDITAVPGAGNLLGNLLCSLAGLLDPTPSSLLADFLNQLLALLFSV